MRCARALPWLSTGKRSDAKMGMIAMTVSSSMRVKAAVASRGLKCLMLFLNIDLRHREPVRERTCECQRLAQTRSAHLLHATVGQTDVTLVHVDLMRPTGRLVRR